jgi:hypothetical protein
MTTIKFTQLKNNKWICKYCNKKLSSKRNLDKHILNLCKSENKCNKCNKSFKSLQYLNRHMSLCVGILKCNKCNKILCRKQTYLLHISKCNK